MGMLPGEVSLGESVDMLFLQEDVNFAVDSCGVEGVGGVVEFIDELEAVGQPREVHGDHPDVRDAQFGIKTAAMWLDIQKRCERFRGDHHRRNIEGASELGQGRHWRSGACRWRRR